MTRLAFRLHLYSPTTERGRNARGVAEPHPAHVARVQHGGGLGVADDLRQVDGHRDPVLRPQPGQLAQHGAQVAHPRVAGDVQTHHQTSIPRVASELFVQATT